MHELRRKKTHVFFGNVQPKSNARTHLKQRKENIVALMTRPDMRTHGILNKHGESSLEFFN